MSPDVIPDCNSASARVQIQSPRHTSAFERSAVYMLTPVQFCPGHFKKPTLITLDGLCRNTLSGSQRSETLGCVMRTKYPLCAWHQHGFHYGQWPQIDGTLNLNERLRGWPRNNPCSNSIPSLVVTSALFTLLSAPLFPGFLQSPIGN
jgi:hypothetical protein